ncbi:MAG: hypothetical protein K1Y36_02395 [Blastocatellia bacterium]|nr:hypothetical protein [Blastocatellia bacterium]
MKDPKLPDPQAAGEYLERMLEAANINPDQTSLQPVWEVFKKFCTVQVGNRRLDFARLEVGGNWYEEDFGFETYFPEYRTLPELQVIFRRTLIYYQFVDLFEDEKLEAQYSGMTDVECRFTYNATEDRDEVAGKSIRRNDLTLEAFFALVEQDPDFQFIAANYIPRKMEVCVHGP